MVLKKRAVLQFFIFMLTAINGLHSRPHYRQNSLRTLSEYIGSNSPIIVYIGSDSLASDLDDVMARGYTSSSWEPSQSEYSGRNHHHAKLESTYDIFRTLIRDDDSKIMLRTGKRIALNSEEQLVQEKMIAQALRSRCQAIVECEEKCPEEDKKNSCSDETTEKCSDETTEKCSEESDPCSVEEKTEKYCPKSCKAVFDHLINCPPPGNEKKKYNNKHKQKNPSTQACGPPTGRTMPPNWKHH